MILDLRKNTGESHRHPTDLINIEIRNIQELEDAFGSGGTYNVVSDVSITFMEDIVIPDVFDIALGVDFIMQAANHAIVIEFTNTGTIFTHAGNAEIRITQGKFTFSGDGATLFDAYVTNYYQTWATFTCTGAGISLGYLNSTTILLIKDSAITSFANGFTIDSNFLAITSGLLRSTGLTANTTLTINSVAQAAITDTVLVIGPNESMFYINPIIEASFQFDGITNITGLGDYFKLGDIGSITLFTDATISAQGITSVTDSGGVARFNWTAGAIVFVGQEVKISGYTVNTAYNGTFIITTVGSGYFEVSSVAFGSDEATGGFDSDTVIVTSATHGLSNEDTLLITDTMDYNTGSIVYNAQTDTFQINAVYSAAETSGTWDTGSLTQESKYLNVINSGKQKSSSIGTAMSVKNSIAETTIVESAWNPMNFGTVILGDLNSRFILIDAQTGERRYEGQFPINLGGFVSISAEKGNADVISYIFRMIKTVDTQSDPFDAVEMTRGIDQHIGTISFAFSGTLYPGDQFRPEVMAGSDAESIFISSYSDAIK